MTEDERLDELLRSTLMESRRPPEPPLDDMWAQIERRAFDAPPLRSVVVSRGSHWGRTLLAAAATLAIGVALGRYVAPRRHDGGSPVAVSAGPAAAAAPVATSSNVTPETHPVIPDKLAANDDAAMATATAHRRHRSPAVAKPDTLLETGPLPDASAVKLASQLEDVSGGTDMSRYLVRTAALLGALPSGRASHTSVASDTVIANRAGELLTETHLLLDSQAGSDPTLHRLLEDLELVLAQVARLRAPRSGPDLQLIHQALAFRDVLPRVHDAAVEASITN
jgi:hypothetical protein